MCNQQLIEGFEVAMKNTSVPFASGHGVFLFHERNKANSTYLGLYTIEKRSCALLLCMGLSPYYNHYGFHDIGYRNPHNKLVLHWVSFAAEWVILNKFNQKIEASDLVFILEAAYNIINTSSLLKKDKNIINEVCDHLKKSINNYITVTGQHNIEHYLSPKSRFKAAAFSSSNITSYESFFESDIYELFFRHKSNFFELYFWVRLEALLRIQIIFDITINSIESALRCQNGSFVEQVKLFVKHYSSTSWHLSYSNDFFKFIDPTATNPQRLPTFVTDVLNGIPFMTIDNGCWSADFDSFLGILNTRCPTTYTKMLEYDKAAISVAYAFTDNLMFKKPNLPQSTQSVNNLQKDWDYEMLCLEKVFKTKQAALVGGFFNRTTVAARVHNGFKSEGYYTYYAVQQAKTGNVVLDARAHFAVQL